MPDETGTTATPDTAAHQPVDTSVITPCPEHAARTGRRTPSEYREMTECALCTRTDTGPRCGECGEPWPCETSRAATRPDPVPGTGEDGQYGPGFLAALRAEIPAGGFAVEVAPVTYRVTIMPAGCLDGQCPVAPVNELRHWVLYVAKRRQGWIVTDGGSALSKDTSWPYGRWGSDRVPEDDTAGWIAEYCDETAKAAIGRARAHAPVMMVSNVIASHKLARHMRAHAEGRRDAEFE